MTANRVKPSPVRVTAIVGSKYHGAKSLKTQAVDMAQVEMPRQDEESLGRQAKTILMETLYRAHYRHASHLLYWSCSRCRAERQLFHEMGMVIIRQN